VIGGEGNSAQHFRSMESNYPLAILRRKTNTWRLKATERLQVWEVVQGLYPVSGCEARYG